MLSSNVFALSFARGRRHVGALALTLSACAMAHATYPRALDLLEAAPAQSWVKLNTNDFSSVWTPVALQPDTGNTPSSVITAWGGLAWDSMRGQLVAHGGGHANYKGNEVYTWELSSGLWRRASLPSALVPLSDFGVVNEYASELMPVDGAVKGAPGSCHQYASPAYLPVVDRVVYFCGAGHVTGRTNIFARVDGSVFYPGPFFWNPALADPMKVGGTQGSHVRTDPTYALANAIIAGNMWQGRGLWENINVGEGYAFLESASAYRRENGFDVLYVVASPDNSATSQRLYRYAVHPSNNPTLDTWEWVGEYWNGYAFGEGGAFIHPTFDIFVRPSGAGNAFVYWKLDATSRANPADNWDERITPTLANGTNFSNVSHSSLSWDSKRSFAVIWQGGSSMWKLQGPATFSESGWVISAIAVTNPTVGPDVSLNPVQNRMRYLPELDAYVAVAEGVRGDVWAYKPADWTRPGVNVLPSVSISLPAAGLTHKTTDAILLRAEASDSDGSVVRVDFALNGTVVAQKSAAPWEVTLTNTPPGNHQLTAMAVDNLGGQRVSTAQSLVVLPTNAVVVKHEMSPLTTTGELGARLVCQDGLGVRSPTFTFGGLTDARSSVFGNVASGTQCIASIANTQATLSDFVFPAFSTFVPQINNPTEVTLRSTALGSTQQIRAVDVSEGTLVSVTCNFTGPALGSWRRIFEVPAINGTVTVGPIPQGATCTLPSGATGVAP